jgi:hypothetical protein
MSVRKVALVAVLCLGPFFTGWTQASQPQDPQSDPDVPITGIEYLLLGGGAYGVSRLLKRRKKS